MRFGVYVPTFGEYDVGVLAELAREAEGAGWDGFFIWDHLAWTPDGGHDLADTTVALTAIALATERLRFGALVAGPVNRCLRAHRWRPCIDAPALPRAERARSLRRQSGAGGFG